eukprot:s1017_g6.t1
MVHFFANVKIHVPRKTLQLSLSRETLQYINGEGDDPEHEENRQFHAALLLGQMRALWETNTYHLAYPWHVIVGLDCRKVQELLAHMKTTWAFVREVIDTIPLTHPMGKAFFFVRHQAFRDVMVKAEQLALSIGHRNFDFDPCQFNAPAAAGFRNVIRSVGGMTNAKADGLLSSLPSELSFNDLRDASKRSRKSQQVKPEDLHAVASKSSVRRNMGCSTLDVMDGDWGPPMDRRSIKTSIFNGFRQSDCSLGLSSDGLTRHRVNHVLTKPHIFCQRLEIFEALLQKWEGLQDLAEDDRVKAIMDSFRDGWVADLVPVHWCVGFLDEEHSITKNYAIVIRAGPHHLLCLWLKPLGLGVYTLLHDSSTRPFRLLVNDFQKLKVCQAVPSVASSGSLVWKLQAFMELKDYLADHAMLEISAANLSKVCSAMKLRGHSKFNHKHRVELFLKEMQRPDEFIQEILASLPDKPPRKKANEEAQEPEDGEDPDGEDEDLLGEAPNPEGEEEIIELLQVPEDVKEGESKQEEDVGMDERVEPEREDGAHAPPGVGPNRGKFDTKDLPPGCTANFAEPKSASPFLQIHLPLGMKFNGRKSKCASFSDGAQVGLRCTVRTKDAAIRSALAWAWKWYHGLSTSEQAAVKAAAADAAERQPKRPRGSGDIRSAAPSPAPPSDWASASLSPKVRLEVRSPSPVRQLRSRPPQAKRPWGSRAPAGDESREVRLAELRKKTRPKGLKSRSRQRHLIPATASEVNRIDSANGKYPWHVEEDLAGRLPTARGAKASQAWAGAGLLQGQASSCRAGAQAPKPAGGVRLFAGLGGQMFFCPCFGVEMRDPFKGEDIHVHFPAGGIPKDGPSAGVAVLLALASLILNRPVRSDTAVTGEVTLRGHVLPVGGIRDKVLAAIRGGDIPAKSLEGVEIHYLKTVDEALDWVFGSTLQVDSGVSANEATEGRVAPFSMRPATHASRCYGSVCWGRWNEVDILG